MLILKICFKMWPHHYISFLQSSDLSCLHLLQQYFLWMDFHPCLYIYWVFLRLLVLEVPFKCKITPQEWGVPKITATQARVEGGSFRDSSSLLGSCLRKSTLYKSDKWEPKSNHHEIVKCLMTIDPNAAYLYKNSAPRRENTHYNTHSC
jgi:hypothetical protein